MIQFEHINNFFGYKLPISKSAKLRKLYDFSGDLLKLLFPQLVITLLAERLLGESALRVTSPKAEEASVLRVSELLGRSSMQQPAVNRQPGYRWRDS